jgi:hypothetical protein
MSRLMLSRRSVGTEGEGEAPRRKGGPRGDQGHNVASKWMGNEPADDRLFGLGTLHSTFEIPRHP